MRVKRLEKWDGWECNWKTELVRRITTGLSRKLISVKTGAGIQEHRTVIPTQAGIQRPYHSGSQILTRYPGADPTEEGFKNLLFEDLTLLWVS